jgi:hypothetical protein
VTSAGASESGPTRLVVQADDFGMCHSVNEGTALAFTDGIVTQASTMAPCPWFAEAAKIARDHSIPLGVHQTLTCEWDYLRWGPITDGPSLIGDDGTFRRTVADAKEHIVHAEAVAELHAQAERITAAGLDIGYFDVHMGYVAEQAYAEVTERCGQPFLYPGIASSLSFTSIKSLSDREADVKLDWLLGWLDRLTPGTHLLVSHCAVPGPEISSITAPDSGPFRWAEEYRKSDLEVLTSPETRAAIEGRGIELVSVTQAFSSSPGG